MSQFEITKRFTLEYAHRLHKQVLTTGAVCKCRRIHGHSARVEIGIVSQRVEPDQLSPAGMVLDFGELDWVKDQLMNWLDHRLIICIDDPAARNLIPRDQWEEWWSRWLEANLQGRREAWEWMIKVQSWELGEILTVKGLSAWKFTSGGRLTQGKEVFREEDVEQADVLHRHRMPEEMVMKQKWWMARIADGYVDDLSDAIHEQLDSIVFFSQPPTSENLAAFIGLWVQSKFEKRKAEQKMYEGLKVAYVRWQETANGGAIWRNLE